MNPEDQKRSEDKNKVDTLEDIIKDKLTGETREVYLTGYKINEQDLVYEFHEKSYHKTFDESFLENWAKYIAREASKRDFSQEQTLEFATVAYNVVSAVEYVMSKKDSFTKVDEGSTPNEIPEALPTSIFKEDLDFDDSDYGILHGTLMFQPSQKKFYSMKTIAECLDLVFKEMQST